MDSSCNHRINEAYKNEGGQWTINNDFTMPCTAQDALDAAQRIREDLSKLPEPVRRDIGLACRVLDSYYMDRKPKK